MHLTPLSAYVNKHFYNLIDSKLYHNFSPICIVL